MILSILKSLSLGVWLGSLLMLGIAVAAPVFQQLPSRTMAGNLNAIILGKMNMIEWVCGTIAFLSSIVLLAMNWNGEFRTLRIIETCLIFLMITMLWFYSSKMTGRMSELRATIQDFDTPRETTQYTEAKKEFDDLHKTYTMFVGINMLLITSGFVLSVVNTRPG
ncbi:MAG: DUF4149 domain-containing protein [Bacteroidota bacterium]|nr:DUF4149 domain-containing protein [Bacteroidota bacterium]MDP4237756.1 DUF4149 domain-containing protein [Bacteroidota bacterium]